MVHRSYPQSSPKFTAWPFKHNRINTAALKLILALTCTIKIDQLQPENETVFKRLEKVAFNEIKEGGLIFGSSEVDGLEDCGLLHQLPDVKSRPLRDPPKAEFCFLHLTFQEFLAAKHITVTMILISWKVSNSDILTELLPKSTTKWRECDLIGNQWDFETRKLTCWPDFGKDKLLALNSWKCLYEIDVEQHSATQTKLVEIGFNAVDFSNCSLSPVDFGAVVHVVKNVVGILCLNLEDNNVGPFACIEIQKLIVNSGDGQSNWNLAA